MLTRTLDLKPWLLGLRFGLGCTLLFRLTIHSKHLQNRPWERYPASCYIILNVTAKKQFRPINLQEKWGTPFLRSLNDPSSRNVSHSGEVMFWEMMERWWGHKSVTLKLKQETGDFIRLFVPRKRHDHLFSLSLCFFMTLFVENLHWLLLRFLIIWGYLNSFNCLRF